MSREPGDRRSVAELIMQIGRIAYSFGTRERLTPAQWTALRFFTRANRFSRTVSAFAEYHSTTRGTASETVQGLVRRKYLVRRRSTRDGRSARLDVTAKARRMLQADPLEDLVLAAAVLSEGARADLASSLADILRELADRRGRRPFGACPACRYLERKEGPPDSPAYACSLLGEKLSGDETEQICVNFRPDETATGQAVP